MIRSEARSNLRLLKHKDLCSPAVDEAEIPVREEPGLETFLETDVDIFDFSRVFNFANQLFQIRSQSAWVAQSSWRSTRVERSRVVVGEE